MASPCCDRFRDDLSAFADHTLTPRRFEQVARHLMDCGTCRAELAAIDEVCTELKSCRSSSPSETLAARLELIAGEHSQAPLYMASGDGELPSARRIRQRRVAQGSVALLAVVMSAVVFAVLIAPDPVRIVDPVKSAREQFSMSSSAISINEAFGAVLLAFDRGADLGQPISYQPREAVGHPERVSSERAVDLLRASTQSEASLTGLQQVWVSDGDGLYRSAEVRTTKVAGEGAKLEVYDARGDRFLSSFLPAFGHRPVAAPRDWTFTENPKPEPILGREAIHLQAFEDGSPVAGWWFDTGTGVLLWSERYASTGAVSLAMGFKELTYGDHVTISGDLTQQLSLQPVTASQTDGWCVGLATCPQEVGGLPLVAYASSDSQGKRSMTLVYSDGFESAVVGWTEGVLADGVGRTHSEGVGLTAVELWQCGDAVVWVTTNGSDDLLKRITADLPAEQPYRASILDRISMGVKRLVRVG